MGGTINQDDNRSIKARYADRLTLPQAKTYFIQKTFVFLAPQFYTAINKHRLNLKSSNLLEKPLKAVTVRFAPGVKLGEHEDIRL